MSTHLYHGQRLDRAHLLEIGAHGFDGVELVATRSHVDYHNPASISDVQQWLAEAGLVLRSVHAPVAEGLQAGRWINPLNLASSDAAHRQRALEEAELALQIARRIPFEVLVVHVGALRRDQPVAAENSRDGARRSIEALRTAAAPLGVRIALEVIPNELSRSASLAHFIERVLDAPDVGICLDLGHAQLEGDVADAIETVSEHLMAIDAHDNGGRVDDHEVPLAGTIDWPAALTAVQKVGYDGPIMFEIDRRGSTKDTLVRARSARQKMERMLAT